LILALSLTVTPSVAADFSGMVEIGDGRKINLVCSGEGSPTVILISGKGDGSRTWSYMFPDYPGPLVFPSIAKFTRVCAYDRPGTVDPETGELTQSDPIPLPTTVGAGVEDLEALLKAANVPAPYVIVGHSMGGAIARNFVANHGDQVAGLVLEDAFSGDLNGGMTEEFTAAMNTSMGRDPEGYDIPKTVEQLRQAPPIRPMPIVVLTAGQSQITPEMIAAGELPPEITQAVADEFWSVQMTSQNNLAGLLPDVRHVMVIDSSHYIHVIRPNAVIDAITDVVEAVRAGDTRLAK
jgi:pimeloyl-ACP methyl ester carboxylesterase